MFFSFKLQRYDFFYNSKKDGQIYLFMDKVIFFDYICAL